MADDDPIVDEHKDAVEAEPEDTTTSEEPTPRVDSASWQENAKAAQTANKEKFGKLKEVARAYWARKKWTLPVTVVVLVVLLLGVPLTRYLLLGTFLRNQTAVVVADSKTAKPVSGATVTIGDKSAVTDVHGRVFLSPKVGHKQLTVSKKYFKTSQKSVMISWPSKLAQDINLEATGRQVPIVVTDKISGKPLLNALIKAAGGETRSDKNGKATIVLPTNGDTQAATIILNGYNTAQVTVQVTDQEVPANSFTLTPTGKVYFLSNQSGKIDVVKTNLDGTGRQTVFPGTGSEDTQSTSLLASRDWKYLALLAKHDGNSQSLYLINTANDNVTNIDGGNASANFTLVGWSDDTFVYQVNHPNISSWQSGAQVLKSYDATSGKLYNIDQSQGEGSSLSDYGFNNFTSVYLLGDEIVYAKNWYSSYAPNHLSGKSASLVSVKADGSSKHSIKDFAIPDSVQYSYYVAIAPYAPQALYVQVPNGDGTNAYYEYEDSKLTAKSDVTDDTFNKPYPTFLVSPFGKQTFWSEVRDNKNTLFVGNADAQSSKQLATLSDYTPYGWYTDNYLLVSKNGSELYIMPADGSKSTALKITNYYKPQLTYRGYGGGYGGN